MLHDSMLKSLIEGKLSTNFIIIQDKEEVCCEDVFIALLANFHDPDVKINLICYEYPPEFYLSCQKIKNKKIILYNYFSDVLGWKNPSTPKTDLSEFMSNPQDLTETVFFIDSVSLLTHYHGFCTAYRNLSLLKKFSKKIVCIAHSYVLTSEQLEELYFLGTTVVKVLGVSGKQNCNERLAQLIFKKPGGKVVTEAEIFNVNEHFNITSKVKEVKKVVSAKPTKDMESLTTFKLGIHLSKEERKAKEDLILPYVKPEKQNRGGEIIYQPEIDEPEEDPDDDLDI